MTSSASSAGPRSVTVFYQQCTPCFRYRARCQSARPCVRCIERGITERCHDVGPPCMPCYEQKLYCDRRRPCKRCRLKHAEDASAAGAECLDGPMEEKNRSEVVELGEDGKPIPPQVDTSRVGALAKDRRRLTEGQKLQAEMEASERKRRRAIDGEDDDSGDDAAVRDKESRRDELIRGQQLSRRAAQPASSHEAPLSSLAVPWNSLLDGMDAHDDDDDEPIQRADEPPVLLVSVDESSEASSSASASLPAHFLSDFSHLFPRPPQLPLSISPIAFLNLWAHFMHVQRHSIAGHHVVIQQRSVTAWDVYRVVVEHGGYQHVLSQRLFHGVLSDICHSASPATPAILASPLPGGPPVVIAALRPRAFLSGYYEKFLYAFELAYQWEKGQAPGIVAPQGKSVASVVEGRRKKRKGAIGVRNDLLKRLWAPVHHALLFKEKDRGAAEEEEKADGDDELGYVGMTRLKRSLTSGVTEEVSGAINRLLRLSAKGGKRSAGGDEDEADDDDDASDQCLLFHQDVISELLSLLLHPPLYQPLLSTSSPAPRFTPLLVHEHLQNLASCAPDYHSAVLVILHNLSSHAPNHPRIAAHTSSLNLLTSIVISPQSALLHVDVEDSWALSFKTLVNVMPAVNLLHIVRREELLSAMISAIQRFLDRALFPDGEEEAEEIELAASMVSGLIGLLTNPHHAANIPYLQATLPSAFFSLLLLLASPLTPSKLLRQLAVHALTFFSLSHRSFAARIVHQRGLPHLFALLTRQSADGEGKDAEEREIRRAAAATVQAIASYCPLSGGDDVRKDGLQWEALWSWEADLFAACCMDQDVSQLLVPVLQRSVETRKRQEAQPAQAT